MLATDLPGAVWWKSSRSANNCACVEATLLDDGTIGVRDSKHPNGDALVFTPKDWDAFLSAVYDGEFTRDALAAQSLAPSFRVAVGLLDDGNVSMRDSHDTEALSLVFTPAEWDAFLGGVHDGEFTRRALTARTTAPSPA